MSVPRHIAIVMDGNGRWARARGEQRTLGHEAGLGPVRTVIEECTRLKIQALTLYAFSSENWSRPAEEVAGLMGLFVSALEQEVPALHANAVRLRFIGERDSLEAALVERMVAAEAMMRANTGLQLQVALSYGGRQDLVQAARALAGRCAGGQLRAEAIGIDDLAAHLALHGLPDPDLFIRTGGEQRLSNFLLWNLAYTELYFTEVLWPDFDARCFAAALEAFAARERRFGRTAEQQGAA